jgi:hypothetical protein
VAGGVELAVGDDAQAMGCGGDGGQGGLESQVGEWDHAGGEALAQEHAAEAVELI